MARKIITRRIKHLRLMSQFLQFFAQRVQHQRPAGILPRSHNHKFHLLRLSVRKNYAHTFSIDYNCFSPVGQAASPTYF